MSAAKVFWISVCKPATAWLAGLSHDGATVLSPTINMSIKDPDLLKLLNDFDYYFDHEIELVDSPTYPDGYIGDGDKGIKISFNTSRQMRKRMTDNIFVVVANQNGRDRIKD